MNELVVAGAAIGGLALLASSSGASAGGATVTAMDYLRANQPMGGVSFAVPANNHPEDAFNAMRASFSQLYGADGQSGDGVLRSQLYEIVNVWIGAYAAGCNKNDTTLQNYRLGGIVGSKVVGMTCESDIACGHSDDTNLTPLGTAVCAASSWRQSLATSGEDLPWVGDAGTSATASDVATTMQLISAMANAMSGADVVVDGARYSDQNDLADLPGNIISSVGNFAGRALGGVASGVVGSSLFWMVGLGLVAYVVLRRGGA